MRLPQSSSPSLSFRAVPIVFLLTLGSLLPSRAVGATQQLQCSPNALRFGIVQVGQTETQLVTVTNSGQSSATITAANSANGQFTTSGLTLPMALAAGQSVSFNVTFTPNAQAWTGGTLVLVNNGSNPNLLLPVGGTGVSSDSLTAAPSSLSFGQVTVGSTSTLTVVLTNTRPWKETLSAFQVYGNNFSVSGPSMPLALGAGQTVTLQISFTPQAAGQAGGNIFVLGPNLSVPVNGTGSSNAVGQLTITPGSLNFGNVDVGSSTTQPTTVNAVGGSVTISSAASNNSEFTLSGASFPMTIAAGQSAALNVVFAPSKSGSTSGSLTLASNASNSQAIEGVSGVGIVPTYTVNLSWNQGTSSVAGYNVYRGTATGSYTKINSSLDPNTSYSDSTVSSGVTYYYAATSVSTSGQESGYSSPLQVVVP